MAIARREFLRLAGFVAASAAASSCAPIYRQLAGGSPLPGAWPGEGDGFSVLARMTFGPRPEERQRAAEIGLEGWVEEQLAYESLDDEPAAWRLRPLDYLRMSPDELVRYKEEELAAQLKQGTLLRQVFSRRQLYEVMAEFWSDHFNISLAKGDCWFLKLDDDRQVIRRHALGSFPDLLWASAHSPAMLVYLDNQVNDRSAPNENYARELMELHTLGVHGGYTQADVMELARCLTGWTVKAHFWRGQFAFEPDMHDEGSKLVLGEKILPAGQAEAEGVLARLSSAEATARFVAFKLAQRFLHDDPTSAVPEIVERAAAAFRATQGDVRAVLRVVLLDGLVRSPAALGPKFKRPVDFIVSAVRLLSAETDGLGSLPEYLAQMGQPTFEWPTPDGPPQVAAPWMGNLLPRWKFALALARGELDGTRLDLTGLLVSARAESPADRLAQFSRLLLGARLPEATADSLLESLGSRLGSDTEMLPAILVAGLVASPAFQWR